ncbi:DUF4190 domain-containing protein [Streptomyces adelaidensis]|uniref:DUF4190 domain-containing protein n=1 Tax=Streptomyces adelaidensis TaxID=2796465 RepID=UPI0027DE5F82|nr:DUF4190 domain-containing protein [Streptomyces adelaidensis]
MADAVPLPEDAAPQPEGAISQPEDTVPGSASASAPAPAAKVLLDKPVGPADPPERPASVEPATPAPRDPWAAPADAPAPVPSSVHDQQTVISIPGADPTAPTQPQAPAQPHPWAAPNPFAPPGGPQPPGAQTPPPANPFATPAAPGIHGTHGTQGAPVPPPPISPEGPGQVPYGYPQYPAHTGYPGAHSHPMPGYPAPGYAWPLMPPPPSNGMGIAAMVIGICAAVLFCLWPLAILLGIMAVIFGFVGRAKARRGEATNPGHALAGIICGFVGILLGIAFIVLLIVAPGSDSYDSDTDPFDDSYSTSLSLSLPTGAGDSDTVPRRVAQRHP